MFTRKRRSGNTTHALRQDPVGMLSVDERKHVSWVQARLLQGALPRDSGTPTQQSLGGLEVLIELLLAGIDPEEARVQCFVTLATTHQDWHQGAGIGEVLALVERGMNGEGVPGESLWVFETSTASLLPEPTFKDYLRSESLSAEQARGHGAMAVYWLENLIRLTSASGAWQRVGVGLTGATEANRGALDLALEPGYSEDALSTVVQRQLPIAKIIGIYSEVSQRVF